MTFESHLFLDETILPPSAEWNIPAPGCWRFLRVSGGQGYWMGLPGVKDLSCGDLIVVSPKAQGLVRASQLGELTLHFFFFCPEQLTGLLTLAERRNFESLAKQSRLAFHLLPASNPIAQRFAALCSLRPRNTLRQRCQMLELAGAIFGEEMPTREPKSTRIASARDRFKELIRQMPEGDIINYTPEELARRCGCSLRHFSRLFRRQLGVSIRAKQTVLRLQKAAQMLCDTDAKIAQVAREAGYRHVGLFYAMFKKQFGMTPSEWRDRALPGFAGNDHKIERNALVASLSWGLMCGSAAAGLLT